MTKLARVSLLVARVPSPLGELRLVWDEDGAIRALDYDDYEDRMHDLLVRYYDDCDLQPEQAPDELLGPLEAYFAGRLEAIDGLPIACGGTPFQRDVWQQLRKIPCGTTATYGAIAAAIGRSSSMRAVGAAKGANPIAIVVPCHRVIGANGTLTGYGGGLQRKEWLLRHEGADFAREQPILLL